MQRGHASLLMNGSSPVEIIHQLLFRHIARTVTAIPAEPHFYRRHFLFAACVLHQARLELPFPIPGYRVVRQRTCVKDDYGNFHHNNSLNNKKQTQCRISGLSLRRKSTAGGTKKERLGLNPSLLRNKPGQPLPFFPCFNRTAPVREGETRAVQDETPKFNPFVGYKTARTRRGWP